MWAYFAPSSAVIWGREGGGILTKGGKVGTVVEILDLKKRVKTVSASRTHARSLTVLPVTYDNKFSTEQAAARRTRPDRL